MLFKEVVGQDKIKQHLIESYQHGRTAHAQILVGGEGCGHLALALAYAQYLQCENPTETDACGVCLNCYKAKKFIHPDIHFAFPTIGTGKISNDFIKEWRELLAENPYPSLPQWLQKIGAENQQGNINKNECVEIVRKLTSYSLEGKYKVLILWQPELLGNEGNRLLKLIEEPEENTVFLLVAENPQRILNTILSRCQLVQIPRLSDNEVINYLHQQLKVSVQRAATLAYLAEGNLNKAQQLAETASDDNGKLCCEWLQICQDGNGFEFYKWVKSLNDSERKMGRKQQVVFLQYVLHFLRELLAFKVHNDSEKIKLAAAEIAYIQRFMGWKFGQIQQIMERIDEAIFFIERNVSDKILFLNLCAQLHKIIRP